MFRNALSFITLSALTLFGTVLVFGASGSAAVSYEKKQMELTAANVEADVITVDLTNPEIEISVVASGANGVSLGDIIQNKSTVAVINANAVKRLSGEPLGNLMSEGELLYASSGFTSVGFSSDNKLSFGKPMIFTKIFTTDNESNKSLSWTVTDINSDNQTGEQSVLYTPVKGLDVDIQNTGCVMAVEENIITGFYKVEAGRKINIPQTGYIVYFSEEAAQTPYFFTPEIGRVLDIEHVSFNTDNEGFELNTTKNIVSGEPRLVKDGFAVNEATRNALTLERENLQKTSRIAIGTLSDGRAVFVHAPNASIDELREIMLGLGCINAVNMEGGGYSAMYVNGNYVVKPVLEGSSVIVIKSTAREQ